MSAMDKLPEFSPDLLTYRTWYNIHMTDADSLSLSRRSRAFVTKNACAGCRRRKARVSAALSQYKLKPLCSPILKCDGQHPCSRCAALEGMVCHYAVSVRVSKESMRVDIEQLRTYRRMSEHVLGLLALGQQSEFILQRLREGQRVEDISASLDMQVPVGEFKPK